MRVAGGGIGRHGRVLVEVATGAGFAALGTAMALVADGTPTIPGQAYGPGFFPILIGWAMAAVGILIVLRALRAPRAEAGDRPDQLPPYPLALAWTVLGLAGMVLLFEPAGFVVTATIYLAVFMLLLKVPPFQAVALAAAASLAIDLLFVRFLLVPLPPGILSAFLR